MCSRRLHTVLVMMFTRSVWTASTVCPALKLFTQKCSRSISRSNFGVSRLSANFVQWLGTTNCTICGANSTIFFGGGLKSSETAVVYSSDLLAPFWSRNCYAKCQLQSTEVFSRFVASMVNCRVCWFNKHDDQRLGKQTLLKKIKIETDENTSPRIYKLGLKST